jgi:transcription factor IIIB subunit 2
MPGPIHTGRRPRERLSSIHGPPSKQPYAAKHSSPAAPAPKPSASACCDNPNISSDDGRTECLSCGAQLAASEYSNEITFGENAAGGAVVQGGRIGDGQRHANTMDQMRGVSSRPSREITERRGKDAIEFVGNQVGLHGDQHALKLMAMRLYILALNHNFIQGRRVMHVAAVTLYLAARKQSENTLMLMDFAEAVTANVWHLGDVYKQFCKTVMIVDPAEAAGSQTVQQIEPLMLKFCRKLEFGPDSYRVANDACRVLKSMKRDWMVQGRNPAGLCGACILIAAQMNNFRRSVREVVYVVRVADTTVMQRLQEYRRTASAALTVEQFRKFGDRIKVNSVPPAIYKREEREQREQERKRKAAEALATPDSDAEFIESDDDEAAGPSSQPGPTATKKRPERTTKKQKLDKGMAKAVRFQTEDGELAQEPGIPDVEALAGDTEANLDALYDASGSGVAELDEDQVVVPKKRVRKKKAPPVIIPDEELEIEAELEEEITQTFTNWQATFQEFQENDDHEVLLRAKHMAQELKETHMPTNPDIPDGEMIENWEFEDDPDVRNCLLSATEKVFRERTWVTENEDWMREQQKKNLAKALEEARGETPKVKHRRKVNRMGDGAVLEGETGMSAADAAQKMIAKRGKHFSNAINYDVLKNLFPDDPPTPLTSGSGSASGAGASPAASAGQQLPTPQATQSASQSQGPVGDDEEDDGEEEEQQPVYDEEEEDLNHYEDDDEMGIGEEDYLDNY